MCKNIVIDPAVRSEKVVQLRDLGEHAFQCLNRLHSNLIVADVYVANDFGELQNQTHGQCNKIIWELCTIDVEHLL